MAGVLLASGALAGILTCMEDFDAGVKESAIWAVGHIVKHNINHADAVVSAGMFIFRFINKIITEVMAQP